MGSESPPLQADSLPTVVLKNQAVYMIEIELYLMKLGIVSWVLSNFTRFQLFAHLWTIVCQVSLTMGFSRQEYWNCLLCPPPGDLPYPRIQSVTLISLAMAGQNFTTSTNSWERLIFMSCIIRMQWFLVCFVLWSSFTSDKIRKNTEMHSWSFWKKIWVCQYTHTHTHTHTPQKESLQSKYWWHCLKVQILF